MSHHPSHLLMVFQGTRTKSRENPTPLGDKESEPTLSGTAAHLLTNREKGDGGRPTKSKTVRAAKALGII